MNKIKIKKLDKYKEKSRKGVCVKEIKRRKKKEGKRVIKNNLS